MVTVSQYLHDIDRTEWAPEAIQVLTEAQEIANSRSDEYVGTEHLLLAILASSSCVGGRSLAEFGDDTIVRIHADMDALAQTANMSVWYESEMTPRTENVIRLAYEISNTIYRWNTGQITSAHMILALLLDQETVAYQILRHNDISHDALLSVLNRIGAAT